MKRAVALLLTLAACGDQVVISVADQEACRHLRAGPFEEIAVGELRDDSAPLVNYGRVYRLTTTDGFVAFGETDEELTGIFLSQDVSVEITEDDGDVVMPSSDTKSSPACSEVAHRVAAHLVPGIYFLEIGDGDPPVDLVIASFAFDRDE